MMFFSLFGISKGVFRIVVLIDFEIILLDLIFLKTA